MLKNTKQKYLIERFQFKLFTKLSTFLIFVLKSYIDVCQLSNNKVTVFKHHPWEVGTSFLKSGIHHFTSFYSCTGLSTMNTSKPCLGSGSVGSARFWLPGSRSAKINIQRAKYQSNTAKRIFTQTPNLNY